MKVLTFGEIMLRLKAPGHERFFQSPMLEATFGGGEANVAVSLANYGMDAEFLTILPQNDIADACIRELRYFGVGTKKIVRGEGRMGIYYLEGGATNCRARSSMTARIPRSRWQSRAISTGTKPSRVWTGSISRVLRLRFLKARWSCLLSLSRKRRSGTSPCPAT